MRRTLVRAISMTVAGALLSAVLMAAPGPSSLADAVMQGDAAAVRSMLKQGADVNAAQNDGMTALHWAVQRGDAALVQMLTHAGANVRATTRLGAYTPLVMASDIGDAAIIEVLLKAGADPNASTTTGVTPLMEAAASGEADAVKILIASGADVNKQELAKHETALMFAAAHGRVDAMKVLIQSGADMSAVTKVVDVTSRGRRPAQRAATTTSEPASATARSRDVAGVTRQYTYGELVGTEGGLTPLLFAARQGHVDAVTTLLDSAADINQVSAGDKTSALLVATINGHFDLARLLLERGANPDAASDNGVTPLYAALNCQWAPKALYPQPRAYEQQQTNYLELMKALLEKGADPNLRLKKKVWYSGYNFDTSGVDEIGATPFWRAAHASDVDAMRLLIAHGAEPHITTIKPAGRPQLVDGGEETKDISGLPAVPIGGPAVTPLQAAAGVGYGVTRAGASHRFAPGGWMAAVKYLVEELGADVNARDHEGNTALHHAAARGDNEMILYMVSKGADVTAVNRAGQTTADLANGPVERIQPFPETLALLAKLGAKNNNKCVSC